MTVNGKRRTCDLENDDQNIEMEDHRYGTNSYKKSRLMSSPSCSSLPDHRSPFPSMNQNNNLTTNNTTTPMNNHNNEAFLRHCYESQVMTIKQDHQRQIDQYEKQVDHYRKESQETMRQSQELSQENKILKKGIQIQEQKLKETQNQNQQMMEMLQNAANHIQTLEQINQQLQQELLLYKNGKKSSNDDLDFHNCSYF